MKKLIWFAACLSLAVVFSAPGYAADSEKEKSKRRPLNTITLKLNWRHGVQFMGFYIAREKGFYQKQGLNVVIIDIPSSDKPANVPEIVAAGKADFGIGTEALEMGQKKGLSLTTIATFYQLGPHVLFARSDSGIKTAADIAGHSIAIKSTHWRRIIQEFLALEGITMDQVKEVPSRFDMTPFYEGRVDVWAGFITDEVFRARLRSIELVTFPLYEYGITSYGNHLFTRTEMLEKKPGTLSRFIQASLEGAIWAVDNPHRAVDIFLSIFPEKKKERDFHQGSFNASIPLIRPVGVRVGALDCDAYISRVKIDRKPSPRLCTDEFLIAAWKKIY